jgi:hypothetical protein
MKADVKKIYNYFSENIFERADPELSKVEDCVRQFFDWIDDDFKSGDTISKLMNYDKIVDEYEFANKIQNIYNELKQAEDNWLDNYAKVDLSTLESYN